MRKIDKMRGLLSNLSLFLSEFNKFNSTGARILDSFYHMTLKLLENRIFGMKMLKFGHPLHNVIMDVIMCPENL